MFPKLDFGVHSRKNNVAAVVLTGANGIKLLVVDTAKLLSAGGIRPDPLLEALLDQLLLCLCNRRFLFVQDGFLFALGILHIVVDTDILQVQGFLDNAVSVDAGCTVSAVSFDIATVIGFPLHIPFGCEFGVMHFDVPVSPAGCIKELKHKLLHDLLRHPSGTKLDENLTCRQVFWLHLFQCFHIDGIIFGVKLRRLSGKRQLFPDIAGKVFIRHQVLRLRVVPVAVKRIEKDHALQIFENLLLRFTGQRTHISHIHGGFFAHRYGKRFAAGIHGCDRRMRFNGSFCKQVSLAFQFSIVIQHLKCRKQRIGAVLRKGGNIGSAVNESVLLGELVIEPV